MPDPETSDATPPAPTDTPAAPAAPQDAAPAAPDAPAPAKEAEPAAPVAPAEPAAPEKYEFTPIEGVTPDAEVLSEFEAVAKELKLSNEAANKIIGKIAPKIASRQASAFKDVVSGWEAQTKADKDIGGEKLAENLAVAKRGMEAYFTPEFAAFLNTTGLGNHPEMVRGLHKIGLTVSEDKIVTGAQGTGKPGDARSLYPNSNMNA